MKLGIPTLRRYDLLQRLLDSAERGTVKPTGYIIVDNGGEAAARLRLPPSTDLVTPGKNLGVAASWNLMLDLAGDEPIAIANDDMTMGTATFGAMQDALSRAPFALLVSDWRFPWILFAQTRECTERVGYYDENFFPAYWEDIDYKRRLKLSGIGVQCVHAEHSHVGSASGGSPEGRRGMDYGRGYYRLKWGGPAEVRGGWDAHGRECWTEPFNGKPPPGWSLRAVAQPWAIPLPGRTIIDHIYNR